MPFIPKHVVLAALARPRLSELARSLGVPAGKGSKKDLLVLLAMLPDRRFRELLGLLHESELRAIARSNRIPEFRDPDALADCIAFGPGDLDEPLADDEPGDLTASPRDLTARDLTARDLTATDLTADLTDLAAADDPPDPHAPVQLFRGRARTTGPLSPPQILSDDELPANVTRLRRRPANDDPASAPPQPRRGGDLGFETTLWQAADKLRSNMDAAEYKHVALGVLFLRYISDAFERRHAELLALPERDAQNPEDPEVYRRGRVFWVPPAARWREIHARADAPGLGALLDAAMAAIEAHNPALQGVLPQIYQRPGLEGPLLGELVRLFGGIGLGDDALGRDVLGRVYEYFLTRFASTEGKNGGQFYTPRSVVQLLVAMLAPRAGSSVYDPACGSGGMFVQSERFLVEHGGHHGDLALYGQESNPTTWRLARMNLAIRGIAGDLGPEHADSFHRDLHQDLRADYVLANPPFNTKDWGAARLQDDPRWRFGAPPAQNANFAWVQHIIHHMAPQGLAGFVLANGAMTASTAGEGEIRRAIVEADLVDCMVALPPQLFYSTQIPVSLWLLARDKADPRLRRRPGEVLMIDARDLGTMVDRTHRELLPEEVARVVEHYHVWRGDPVPGDMSRRGHVDVPGLCRSVTLAEIAALGHVLAPGRYVASAAPSGPRRAFADELADIDAALREQLARAAALDSQLTALLDHLRPES
jgi:type I restriction enzyme M protein